MTISEVPAPCGMLYAVAAGLGHAASGMIRAARGVLVGAVALVPLVFLPDTVDVFNLVKLVVVVAAVGVAGALWIVGSSERAVWPVVPGLWRFGLGFLGVFAVATAVSRAKIGRASCR